MAPDERGLGAALALHELLVSLVEAVDALLAVVHQQGVEPHHGLLLHLPLDAAGALPAHDPDGVPGLHVVVVDEVAGAHDAGAAPPLRAVHTNSLQHRDMIRLTLAWGNNMFVDNFIQMSLGNRQ